MIHPGSTHFGVNVPGFVLHSAVHSARPDVKCVIHIHHPACIAVIKCLINTRDESFQMFLITLVVV